MTTEGLCKCDECGSATSADLSDYGGDLQRLCDDCNCSYEWCGICETHYERQENTCRHMFWTEDGFMGAGSDCDEYGEADVLALLRFLGKANATRLRTAIAAHRYWMQFCGSTFGYEQVNCELWNGEKMDLRAGEMFQGLFEVKPGLDEARMGLQWLMTLWSGTFSFDGARSDDSELKCTPEADDLVVQWIDEFLGGSIK